MALEALEAPGHVAGDGRRPMVSTANVFTSSFMPQSAIRMALVIIPLLNSLRKDPTWGIYSK